VRSDEVWLWHAGGPLTLRLGGPGADPVLGESRLLGMDLGAGQRPQLVVPGASWQSAEPASTEAVLVSCIVLARPSTSPTSGCSAVAYCAAVSEGGVTSRSRRRSMVA